MSSYAKVKSWKKRTKDRIVKAFGSKCGICGGKFPIEVYDLHHISPEEKSFGISAKHGVCKSWEKIVPELRKCVLLCANCHRLVHNSYIEIPENVTTFNEEFSEYKPKEDLDICPVCMVNSKCKHNTTCSKECSSKIRARVDWEKIDLIAMYKKHKNYSEIGRLLCVSDTVIRKRIKKLQEQFNV